MSNKDKDKIYQENLQKIKDSGIANLGVAGTNFYTDLVNRAKKSRNDDNFDQKEFDFLLNSSLKQSQSLADKQKQLDTGFQDNLQKLKKSGLARHDINQYNKLLGDLNKGRTTAQNQLTDFSRNVSISGLSDQYQKAKQEAIDKARQEQMAKQQAAGGPRPLAPGAGGPNPQQMQQLQMAAKQGNPQAQQMLAKMQGGGMPRPVAPGAPGAGAMNPQQMQQMRMAQQQQQQQQQQRLQNTMPKIQQLQQQQQQLQQLQQNQAQGTYTPQQLNSVMRALFQGKQ